LSLFVDTSVWSLALRRDDPPPLDEVRELRRSLDAGETVVTTGLVIQELLQGFRGPKARAQIVERFAEFPILAPARQDHIDAADLRNSCRRAGIQIGTIDALLAQLCIRHDLIMLAVDADFARVAEKSALRLWRPSTGQLRQ
jgi:hypothetical protein